MGYYLLDNPPKSPQFYPSRNATPTWAVGVHTSEGPTGPGTARNLARFISQRSDPGSYHAIVDSEETVVLVPPDYTTFSVAASGYNSRTWHICLSGKSAELSPDDANTQAMIRRAGEAIRGLWALLGIDVNAAARWIGTDALSTVGLFCHGDVQPWDRSDAWSTHPDRAALDQQLVNAIRPLIPPTPQDDDMKRYLLRGDKTGEVYLCDAGLGWKWHIPAGQMQNIVWVIGQAGGQFLIFAGSNTIVVEGQTVWVADQAFVDAIPTI
jgi:hypothetical protein